MGGETRDSIRVTAWESVLISIEGLLGVLSTCGGKHGVPFEFRWGSGDMSPVATGESGLLSS